MCAPFVRRCRPLLGTFVEVAVPVASTAAIDLAFAAVAHVQATMSFHDETSDLGRLRHAPVGSSVAVDGETVEVLRLAARLHERSRGLFNVTVAKGLVSDGFLPRPNGYDLRRCSGTAADIEIIDDTHIRCRRALLIDLGGIAKGYAVDRAVAALKAAGVMSALVNAGGDLRVLGNAPHPIHLREADGSIGSMVMVADGALASSSNLRDYRRVRGRWSVPHRGYEGAALPSKQAVTVLAPSCAIADAMTKVVLADRMLADAMLAELGGAVIDHPPLAAAA